jgi:uncharacterized membrane-anchored protein
MDEKSKNKEFLKLAIVILVFAVILGIFIIYLSYPLLSTKTAILSTQPVDPFDIFRGQYITIRYEISSIPTLAEATVNDYIYILLKEDINGTARYESASLNKPSKDKLFIRGKIQRIYNNITQVEYGIEQYFFERDARFQTGGMQIKVKLADNGVARISELLRDNKPIEIVYEDKKITS